MEGWQLGTCLGTHTSIDMRPVYLELPTTWYTRAPGPEAHIAHAKMRARKVNLLHPTQKASRKIEIARQPNAREQPDRGAARAGGHVSVS